MTERPASTLRLFLHPRVVTLLFLGFSAGLPLLLIFSSLSLWLRDYLSRTLGAAAVAAIRVSFPEVGGRQICLVRVAASPRPVFLRPAKSDQVFFYARLGNSTRELPVDQAISYAADHFPATNGGFLARAASRLGA